MTFGDYDYGIDAPDDGGDDDDDVVRYPPDHPMSVENCDHRYCDQSTPGTRERICDDCTMILDPDAPDACPECGESLTYETQ